MLTVHFGSNPVNTENFTLLARVVFRKLLFSSIDKILAARWEGAASALRPGERLALLKFHGLLQCLHTNSAAVPYNRTLQRSP